MTDPFDPATVRLWCKATGLTIGERGRIPELILARFLKAGTPTRAQIIEAHPELAEPVTLAVPLRVARRPEAAQRPAATPNDQLPTVAPKRPAETVTALETLPNMAPPSRRGRKILLPHHYDPRPALFSADQMARQKFWGIETSRERWTIQEVSELMQQIGEPQLVARENIGNVGNP